MFSAVRLIDAIDEDSRDRLIAELRAVTAGCGAERIVVNPTLPGVRNGGDILLHLRFSDAAHRDAVIEQIDSVLTRSEVCRVNGGLYEGMPAISSAEPAAVYRTLLLRVHPDTAGDRRAAFEDDLRLLPRYVPAIHSWQLSRVDRAIGTSEWTHVFEQEFRDLEGLTGPYLMHPIHWAYVDRWFDPECPEFIVRDRVCHSFCRLDEKPTR